MTFDPVWEPQIVTTETGSVYRLDWAARTLTRMQGAASQTLRQDGNPLALHAMTELVVGEPWGVMLTGLRQDAVTERTTSPVVDVRDEEIHERIRSAAQAALLSDEQLARASYVSDARLLQLLGGVYPSVGEATRLAEALRVEESWLVRGWYWAQRPLRWQLVHWWLDQHDVPAMCQPLIVAPGPFMPHVPQSLINRAVVGYQRHVVPLDVLAELLAMTPDETLAFIGDATRPDTRD